MTVTLDSSSLPEAMPMDEGPGNFILTTYAVCKKMEENTEKFVKNASEVEKGTQERWKAANEARRLKEHKVAEMHKHVAVFHAVLGVINLGCSIAGATMGIRAETGGLAANLKSFTKSGGDVLTSLGRAVGDHGTKVLEGFQQTRVQEMNSDISKDTEKSQALWEITKRDKESRKEDMKQMQQKIKQATEEAIQKAAATYGPAR
ncbi:hypothetical protein COB11_02835 [Candidatus Aerophobetes bacterium]|uniref:Uncharacterized protein n=1 Tax=Aerophobetes bacterium TaxID=2030807 RepID=A0A2A4YK41_UNCAE|nr:MAG: hypothetical protein COB11_02835 [Candidatus Aerophobetes bacterium]